MGAMPARPDRPGSARGLLAVDVGLRTGLAAYGRDGRLRWYRSHHWADRTRMRRAVRGVLRAAAPLEWVVLEGGGPLAELWKREAARGGAATLVVAAETWRERLLWPRERRTGPAAKRHAGVLARRAIAWSGLPRPTSLRSDAAEAVLVGLWAVVHLGWLGRVPEQLRRRGRIDGG